MAQHIRGAAKVHALQTKADELLQPLIEVSEDEESSIDSDEESSQYSTSSEDSSVKVKPTPGQILKAAAVSIVVGLGAVASVGSIVLTQAAAVIVMACIATVNAPYSAYKEYQIAKLPTLRSMNNKLREDANKLEDEVDELSQEIESLKPEADRAAAVEEELRQIADEQHTNVNKLVDLVKENEIILDVMRDNLRQRIVQDVLRIVLQSDANNDGKFCKVETKMLVLKIKLHLSEYGVEFDEQKFYKVMTRGGPVSISKTLSILKRLIPESQAEGVDDDSEEDEDEDMYDMFRMTSEGSMSSSIHGASMVMGKGERRSSLAYNQQDSIRRQRRSSLLADSPKNSPKQNKGNRKRLSGSS